MAKKTETKQPEKKRPEKKKVPEKKPATERIEDDDDDTNSTTSENKEDGVTTLENLIPIWGSCCVITSLYMVFPECWGTYGNATLGCLELECKSCKVSTRKADYCICFNLGVLCVKPTLVKSVCQCCCFDGRCAIPCHEEVPCLINVCGLNCAYANGCACHCCKTLGYIKEAAEERAERAEKEKK